MFMKIIEQTAVNFIVNNLKGMSASHYFEQEKFQSFIESVKQGNEITAAERYQQVTSANIDEAHIAAAIAHQLFT